MSGDNIISHEEVSINSDFSLFSAVAPVVVLILALSWNVYVFGDEAISGSSQIIILAATAFAAVIGACHGHSWEKMQEGIVATLGTAVPSIIILLLVGALASIWMLSGTVPVLLYYGLKVLNPTIFLVACCIACAVTSLVTGSSWATAATVGLAMVGVGRALGIPDGMIGGAIISGSYFGDKISPLSDSTNLAAAVTGTPLFDHVRYLFFTTGPPFAITLVLFVVLGFTVDTSGGVDISYLLTTLDQRFNINAWLLLPPAIVFFLIVKKVPAIPSLFSGIVLGIVFAYFFQPKLLSDMTLAANEQSLYRVLMTSLYAGVDIATENKMLSSLLSTSGMQGMLNTIWLIIMAMAFGGLMEASGMLLRIMESLKVFAKSFFGLVSCTVGTCLMTNVSASDQYIAVAIPGRMYAQLYKEMGYSSKNLSRTIEDSGTVTSVLIPWNTCGAYHAAVLGIGTLTYLPYCFFNLLSPIMTLIFAYGMIKISKIKDSNSKLDSAEENYLAPPHKA